MRHLASFGDSGSSFSFEMPDRGPPRAYGGVRASPFQPPPVMEGALGPIEPLSFQHRGWMDKNGWACSKTCRYLDGRCVVRQHHARGLQRTLEWRDNDELRIPPLNRFLRPHSPLSTLSQMDPERKPDSAIDTCSSVACWTPKAVSRASRCSVVPRAHRPSLSGWRNIHEIPELARGLLDSHLCRGAVRVRRLPRWTRRCTRTTPPWLRWARNPCPCRCSSPPPPASPGARYARIAFAAYAQPSSVSPGTANAAWVRGCEGVQLPGGVGFEGLEHGFEGAFQVMLHAEKVKQLSVQRCNQAHRTHPPLWMRPAL